MSLRFFAWARGGAAALVGQASSQGRLEIPLELRLNQGTLSAGARLPLAGPGDVTGIDARAILRVWPAAGSISAYPGDLPCVEFEDPGFPWRFTPSPAGTGGRLNPWIVLLVLEPHEIEGFLPAGSSRKLPGLRAKPGALPDPTLNWAWAHAQSDPVSGTSLSRLLASRPLDARRRYQSFLVPAFEIGRLAGLGLPVSDSLSPLQPASFTEELPVYYHWEFRSGNQPEFETLVRALKPFPLPAEVGTCLVSVAGEAARLPMKGALVSPGSAPSLWPVPECERFVAKLLSFQKNQRAGLAPPLYGGGPAKHAQLEKSKNPVWFFELNSDPRWRAAAGLGAEAIRLEQESLAAEAWRQAGEADEANEKIRRGRFGAEAAGRLQARYLAGRSAAAILRLTAPAHSSISSQGRSVEDLLRDSPIPPGVLSGAFRRTAPRRKGPLAGSLEKLNRGDMAPPKPAAIIATRGAAFNATPGLRDRLPSLKTARQLGSLAADLFDLVTRAAPVRPRQKSPAALEQLKSAILDRASPSDRIATRLSARFEIGDKVRQPPERYAPLQVAPEFDRPAYELLAAISPAWLLPGLDAVPDNTVSLARANPAFIEAFLAGLNHEMAAELKWRGFPVDQDATFFRRFWGLASGPEIPPLRDWAASSKLGSHLQGAALPLVVVVRGEVVSSQPDVQLLAVRAVIEQGRRQPSRSASAERLPLFQGRLGCDTIFAGFSLSLEEARQHPGWYFVVQEPFDAPRFRALTPGNADTADDVAVTAVRRPARVAMHAEMLLPKAAQ